MQSRTDIVKAIDKLLLDLSQPLSDSEVHGGWTERGQAHWKNWFEELRQNLIRGETIPEVSIGYGMDHWGIVEGNLLEDACKISEHLRRLRAAEKK